MRVLTSIVFTGIGATALVDLWSQIRKRALGTPPPNYALVGRWIAGMAHGKWRHASIAAAPPRKAERPIGWTAHYLIGISFAALLFAARGAPWFREPTLVPALMTGILTVAAPFLVMQPAMGAGFAASRTPRPGAARMQSAITHLVFGLGLYSAALGVAQW